MKFSQFMSYFKRNNFIKRFYKKCGLETSSRPIFVCKELTKNLLENKIFGAIYLYKMCNKKTIEISQNQHGDLLRFLFTEDSLKLKKDLELVSRQNFPQNFMIKKVSCNVT